MMPIKVEDQGKEKARELGITHFPALVLVNPKSGQYQAISYGFKSASELSERLLKINNGWKAGF